MRVLCDEMLTGLARWLRAAGHDAAMAAPGTDDTRLLAFAGVEDRLFLTRDRGLTQHRAAAGLVVLLEEEDLDEQAIALRRRLCLDWLHAPFTRCLACNVRLQDAAPESRDRLPQQARELPGPVCECPSCGRVYWAGSHVRRMRRRLEHWSQGKIPPGAIEEEDVPSPRGRAERTP